MIIVGLDLSLTSLGMAAVPSDWGLDWSRLRCRTLAAPDSTIPLPVRIAALARDVASWLGWLRSRDKVEVWAESVPTHAAHAIVPLARLRGVVEHELLTAGVAPIREAPQSTIRKLFLGKLPPHARKQAVLEQINQMAPGVFEDHDQADAFVVANYGLSFVEGAAFVALPAPPARERSRRRARAGVS